MKPVIETQNLVRHYGSLVAVDHLNLAVPAGSLYGFLGPNGAGKTSTIRMLLGLAKPTSGVIRWFGEPLQNAPLDLLRQVGSLVETPSYYPNLTGRENLEVIRRLCDGDQKDIQRVLALTALEKDANRLAGQYSLGMRQRLGLAIALLNNPRVLLLDEPTNGLDPAGIHEMRDLFHRLTGEGVTLFISSHLLSEMDQLDTHFGILQSGRMLFQGTPEDLKASFPRRLLLQVDRQAEAGSFIQSRGWKILSSPNRHIEIPVHNEDEAGQLNQILVSSGFIVSDLHLEQLSLEEIFLQLTRSADLSLEGVK